MFRWVHSVLLLDFQLAPADQTLENKFAALEGGGVEDELANLKKNMFKSKPTLPEGRPIRSGLPRASEISLQSVTINTT